MEADASSGLTVVIGVDVDIVVVAGCGGGGGDREAGGELGGCTAETRCKSYVGSSKNSGCSVAV